jgi:putative redox protein
MNVKVTWQERMSFKGEGETQFTVPLGADPKVGGDNDGFRPMELIALGLAGCTAMDVISILAKKRQDVTDFEVKVDAARADEHPKVFTEAVIEYHVTGHELDEGAVVRAIELSAQRYCPAQAMFAQIMPIELKYHIYEAQEDGQTRLVKSGEYLSDDAQD